MIRETLDSLMVQLYTCEVSGGRQESVKPEKQPQQERQLELQLSMNDGESP